MSMDEGSKRAYQHNFLIFSYLLVSNRELWVDVFLDSDPGLGMERLAAP
jgi:hypothetical protein